MPHDVIEDQVTDFGEGVKSDIKLFAFILQSCVKQMDDVHAYLLGEDNHVYGVWTWARTPSKSSSSLRTSRSSST